MQVAPGNRAIRSRVISFLHRMVECLGPHLLPYLPPALSALLRPTSDASDLADVLSLLQQLVVRYKATLSPLLSKALPECIECVHKLLSADYDWSGRAALPAASSQNGAAGGEDARELLDLQRTYYNLLHAMTCHDLAPALLQATGFETALEALVQGALRHQDAATRRLCIQVASGAPLWVWFPYLKHKLSTCFACRR